MIDTSQQSTKEVLKNRLKDILDQAKQSIADNNSEHKTSTLATTFHKPVGRENPYVWFGYSPQTIFNHTRRQVSGSMNSDPINANKQLSNQQLEDDD